MHKTIYIDVDEEITSILDRVRSEEADNIILVVPKSAMLTQGVINLKLLKKEIDEMGKTVTIATNDKHARKVVERLEIKTQEAKGDIMSEEAKPKQEKRENKIAKKATDEAVDILKEDQKLKELPVDSVGSSGFFDQEMEESAEEKNSPKKGGDTLDLSSELEKKRAVTGEETINLQKPQDLKSSLYSKKENKEKTQDIAVQNIPTPISENKASAPQMDVAPRQKKVDIKDENPMQKDLFGNAVEEEQVIPTNKEDSQDGEAAKKAEKFFSGEPEKKEKKEKKEEEETVSLPEPIEKEKKKRPTKLWTGAIALLLVIGGLAGVFAWGYANYPKVSVVVFPKKEVLSKEIKIVAKEGVDSSSMSPEAIPGEYVEMVISKSMDFDATGETYESDDGKARGKVVIKNEYSSSAQPLVKTTRLLSKEGKLFRIVKDITVPGMDGETPGEIEVDVIADEPGEDYNIGPSTFTIEGFKGNPKYEGFKVSSSKSMTDGGAPDSNKKMSMVTQDDIDNARKETIEALDKVLEHEVSLQLGEDKKVLIDSVEKEVESSKSSHKASEVASTFTFTVNQKVKAMSFSTEDVNVIVTQELEEEVPENFAMDSISRATFKKGIASHADKTLTMYVDAEAEAWPVVINEEIIAGVAGKNENEIQSFLSGYPNIEKVEITITPSWLTTIPVSKDKIIVEEKRL